jgi:4-amino-4-deoxy-L-arabinose transferase-like glycosyltransferase
VDESYMVASGRALSFGYYDHPPIAWWLSACAAHLLGSDAPLIVRLPFIALFAVSTWLMERLGKAIASERTGLWSAVLLNLSPVFGVTTGTWVLPDGPLDCALLGAALCLVRALERGGIAWWLGTGVCAGLALLSKYSAVLTIGGALLYLLTSGAHRHWLTTPKPWLAALVALLMFSPVLAWNATHGWASFAFQAARAVGGEFHPLAPLATFAGEALFVLPWIWLPMMVVFARAVYRGPGEWRGWLLCCLAAPPIVAFAAVSTWASQRVLFHWAAPGYLMLVPLLGDALASRLHQPAVRGLLAGTAIFVVLAMMAVAAQLHYDWLHGIVERFTHSDPDIEAADWTSLRRELPPGDNIVGVPNWRDAGKIAYALGPAVTVLCLNRDARQFAIASPAERFIGTDMLILAPEHRERITAELGPLFEHIERLPDVSIRYAGRTLQSVAVFRAHRLRTWPPPS